MKIASVLLISGLCPLTTTLPKCLKAALRRRDRTLILVRLSALITNRSVILSFAPVDRMNSRALVKAHSLLVLAVSARIGPFLTSDNIWSFDQFW